MAQLTNERCAACRRDSPRVTEAEIAQLHRGVAEWALVEDNGIPRLMRTFLFDDFAGALAFTDAVGAIAEDEGHHPRLATQWGRVTVTWSTYIIQRLHRNDFIMAAKTDQVYARLVAG